MKSFFIGVCALLMLNHSQLRAEEEARPRWKVEVRRDHSGSDNLLNFGTVYAGTWGYYLVSQKDIIEEHGSFKNWLTYPFSPHFDRDSFDYNIFKHSLAGSSYYLWYRSRGYMRKNAFIWAFLSSLAFEFTIETVTERPSYQDIYQTPVFGTVVGIGVENLSLYLHGLETWYGHALGYLINPFTLIPQRKRNAVVGTTYFDNNRVGAMVSYKF